MDQKQIKLKNSKNKIPKIKYYFRKLNNILQKMKKQKSKNKK